MNELERHEAAVAPKPAHAGGVSPGSAKAEVKDAAETARTTAKSVGDEAEETLKSVKQRASAVYDDAADAARQGYAKMSRTTAKLRSNAPRSAGEAGDVVARYVEENPVMVGVIGLAAGLILGSVLPGTRRENQVFGRYADEVKDQGLRYARDLAEQGKHYVEESLQTVRESAESGRQA